VTTSATNEPVLLIKGSGLAVPLLGVRVAGTARTAHNNNSGIPHKKLIIQSKDGELRASQPCWRWTIYIIMSELSDLLKKALKPPSSDRSLATLQELCEVPKELIKPIATKCRQDDYYIIDCCRALQQNLEHKNGYVRMRALYMIDYFFTRSKLFRSIMSKELKTILRSSGLAGIKGVDIVVGDWQMIESKVKVLIEMWDISFGQLYPEIRTMKRYLAESLRLDMPNIMEHAIAEQEAGLLAERQHNARLISRCLQLIRDELSSKSESVLSGFTETNRLLELLFPMGNDDEDITNEPLIDIREDDDDVDDVDWESHEDGIISSVEPVAVVTEFVEEGHPVTGPAHKQRRLDQDVLSMPSTPSFSVPSAITSLYNHVSDVGATQSTLVVDVPVTATTLASEENAVLVQTLKSLYSQMLKHHGPWLKKWLRMFMKAESLIRNDRRGEIRLSEEDTLLLSRAVTIVKDLYLNLLRLLNGRLKILFSPAGDE
jgi:hypothetical protein